MSSSSKVFFSLNSICRLKLECEKLANEKTEMQRHYVMVSLQQKKNSLFILTFTIVFNKAILLHINRLNYPFSITYFREKKIRKIKKNLLYDAKAEAHINVKNIICLTGIIKR